MNATIPSIQPQFQQQDDLGRYTILTIYRPQRSLHTFPEICTPVVHLSKFWDDYEHIKMYM